VCENEELAANEAGSRALGTHSVLATMRFASRAVFKCNAWFRYAWSAYPTGCALPPAWALLKASPPQNPSG